MCHVHICTYVHLATNALLPLDPTVHFNPQIEGYFTCLTTNKIAWTAGTHGPLQPPNCLFFYIVTCLVDCFYPSNPQSQSRRLLSLCIILLVHAYFMHFQEHFAQHFSEEKPIQGSFWCLNILLYLAVPKLCTPVSHYPSCSTLPNCAPPVPTILAAVHYSIVHTSSHYPSCSTLLNCAHQFPLS